MRHGGAYFHADELTEGTMIDTDLSKLAEAPPDHALEELEARIWVGVARRQAQGRIERRLLALQGLVLVVALIGSMIAGQHQRALEQAGSLDIFSPHMPLTASTLLVGNAP
jgi:hypothetical protein